MGAGNNLTVYRDPKEGPAYREFYEKTEVDKILAEKDAKIAGFENAVHWDNSEALVNAVEKTKSLEEELAKARDEIKSLKAELFDKTKVQVFSVVDQRIEELKADLKKKGAANIRLECEKRDLWLRFVQLRRALCILRIGFALRFGGASLRKKVVAYWKHRCKTAPYWDSKTYNDIPQAPIEKEI